MQHSEIASLRGRPQITKTCCATRPISSHRTRCLAWARQHVTWTRQQWGRVLFSDESRFTLSFNDGPRAQPVRRRFRDGLVRPESRYPDGVRYRDEVLRPVALPALATLGQGAIFQDNNAPAHRERLVTSWATECQQDGLASVFARSEPDRASLGCSGTAAQVEPRPTSYPGQAGPGSADGVERHPSGNPPEPCPVDASPM